jgi:NitT/TauT family transport system substrate-binding protein
MTITRRTALLAGLSAPAILHSLPALAQATAISVGHVMAADFVPLFVGKENGIFARNGLDVTNVRVPIIVNIPPALLSGSIQIGAATMPLLLQAVDGGLDLVLISGGARHLRQSSKIGLVVRKDLKIEKPADLKGRKIAVAGFNSLMDVFLRKWLIDKGVNPKEVTFVEAQFPSMPDLIRGGTIDAATVTEPFRSMIVNAGTGYVAAEYVSDVAPDVLVIGYIATREWATKNAQAVRAFRASLDEANAWMFANVELAKDIEQKNLNSRSPALPALSTAIKPDDLEVYIAIGKELGLYKSQLDAAKLIWN